MKRLIAALATGVAIALPAFSQGYPEKPVRIIVPFAPGGTTDIVARIIAEPLRQALGQSVVIDNKGGGGGSVGAAEVARADPDGYTLGLSTVSTMVILPATNPNLPYKIEDFAPVTNIAATPNIIAVHPSFPAKDLKEFIAVIKANPDKYSYATSGMGSINHMMGESFQAGSGTKLLHVPYRGSGPAIQDVIGGNVPILVDNLPSSKPFIEAGKLRLIGVINPQRVADFPTVLTMEEAGMKGFNDQAWYGIVAPAKTPPAILAKIYEAMMKVLARPDVRKRLEDSGAIPVGNTPAQYTAQIRDEVARMKKLVTERNIKMTE
jgi:tripartite-type tricarboxylate transporter receptor subunit TctC